jgi:tetratricopeptide (TPR) repeat protein
VQQGVALGAFVVLVIPYVYQTRKQIGYWHDSVSLFSYTLQSTDNNGIAEENMGAALVESGQPELAQTHFEAAVRLIPELASAHYNLGFLMQRQNRAEQAARVPPSHRACRTHGAAQAHNNLGILYLMSKNYSAALLDRLRSRCCGFQRAAEISPSLRPAIGWGKRWNVR